jgi:hypothetical protein
MLGERTLRSRNFVWGVVSVENAENACRPGFEVSLVDELE